MWSEGLGRTSTGSLHTGGDRPQKGSEENNSRNVTHVTRWAERVDTTVTGGTAWKGVVERPGGKERKKRQGLTATSWAFVTTNEILSPPLH